MDTNELNEYLKQCINSFGIIHVDESFIQYRDDLRSKFRKNGREEEQMILNADRLLLEWILLKRGLVQESVDKLHDFCLQNYFIDLKCIATKYLNINRAMSSKLAWMRDGISKNLLTHFAFYKMHGPKRGLQVNDEIQFEYLNCIEASHVLNNLKTSRYDGYYYEVTK
jgi:hypothetical protein